MQQPPQKVSTNFFMTTDLQRLRELFAGFIAIIMILGMIVLLVIAVFNISSIDVFNHAKDLLLVINPFVGVVIGYYFNKVTSDARAENAEADARTANLTAQDATIGQTQAESQARAATAEASNLKGALGQVVNAVENAGGPSATGTTPGTLGVGAKDSAENIQLLLALERAKQLLN
jgi:hypothetical protein